MINRSIYKALSYHSKGDTVFRERMTEFRERYISPSDQDYDKFVKNFKLAMSGQKYDWVIPSDQGVIGRQINAEGCKVNSNVTGLVLIMIVKNESEIIKRCLNSTRGIVEGICITDTSSEHPKDNPKIKRYCPDIIDEWATENNMPCVIPVHEFTKETFRFDIARTLSFINGRKYFPNAKYFLTLDADMELMKIDEFDVDKLMLGAYTLYQQTPGSRYTNTRIIAANTIAKVKGCTHEYWSVQRIDAGSKRLYDVKQDTLHCLEIKDNDDGRCKEDKFVRDKYLLERDMLRADTSKFLRVRYTFYLAQTYLCLREYQKSMDFYSLRHSYEHWDEERWYCLFKIGEILISLCQHERYKLKLMKKYIEDPKSVELTILNNAGLTTLDNLALQVINQYELCDSSRKKAVQAMEKAWQYRPTRAEPFHSLSTMYRNESNNELGFYYAKAAHDIGYPLGDKLFIDVKVYDYMIDFGLSICGFYLPNQKNYAVQAHRRLKKMYDKLPIGIQTAIDNNDSFYKC